MSWALDPAWDVLGDGDVLERRPPGEDHIHEHERLLAGRPDEDVVRGVIGPVEGEFQRLASHCQGVAVLERHLRWWAVRVVVAQQQGAALAVADPYHIRAEQGRCPDVVGVGVRVDQVRDLAGPAVGLGDRADRAQQVVADGRRRVDQDHAVSGGEEHGRVERVGHPVQVALDLADEVAVGVDRGPQRPFGYRRELAWRADRPRRPGGTRQRPAEQGGRGCGRPRAGEEGAAARRRFGRFSSHGPHLTCVF